ncbi:MAG: ABC transporter ATP-binding protein [Deltaproteobacteria bacterium]|nr:ABC transporter ATP-binding protein [Deltaproteobacteria bacterium]
MDAEVAVSLRQIEKHYRLYQSPLARFKEALDPRKRHYFQDFQALKGIDLEIPRGQTWGLIGLNGSGKSTLLKIVCGVLQPSRGRLTVNGRISALLELGSGFNPQYTGRQNVFFSGALADVGRAEMEVLFPEIEAFAEIGEFIDQPVKSYSSGMLMRLAFAVAIHVSPDILVVDEALAVGDARFQHKCMKKIKAFKEHSTMLLVTHDMNAVLTLCDQVAWLHEGRLVEVGKPKKIVDKYTQAFYEGGPAETGSASTRETDSPQENQPAASKPNRVASSNAECNSFGTGAVTISQVSLCSRDRGRIDSVYGGENVTFHLQLESKREILEPIVGFLVKNKLGIEIFGFNNLSLQTAITPLEAGETYRVSYSFVWPAIASDSYAISIAIAEGNQEKHTVHHWIHDVMTVEVLRLHQYQFGLIQIRNAGMEICRFRSSADSGKNEKYAN